MNYPLERYSPCREVELSGSQRKEIALDLFQSRGFVHPDTLDDVADVYFDKFLEDYAEVIKSAPLLETIAKRFVEAANVKRHADRKASEGISGELKLIETGIQALENVGRN